MTTSPRPRRRLLTAGLTVLATAASVLGAAPAQASNVVTPGSFTGYGFDQCHTPSQAAMDAWLTSSPYWAVGIYISGDSRFCRDQPNLTPTWVDTQLANGWRLLPITLGPQASCSGRDRYKNQVRIKPDPTSSYALARQQGRAEAGKTVTVARDLGIAAGSTLWYDIEAFDITRTDCRESALSFLSAWTTRLHELHYVSGVYSSGGSGIKMIDDARALRPGTYAMPDQLWIADWNGKATVSSSYVRSDGWMPHKRVHQYRGGHDETHGGVRINIDSNFLDLGRGSVASAQPRHCGKQVRGGVSIDFGDYTYLAPGSKGAKVKALQCILREKKKYTGRVDGVYSAALGKVIRSFRLAHGLGSSTATTKPVWMVLLSGGSQPLLKYGSANASVRRVQRALNAASGENLAVTGTFEGTTTAAVKRYQAARKLPKTGVVTTALWAKLQAGVR